MGALLVPVMKERDGLAEESWGCKGLERAKWAWSPLTEDFQDRVLDLALNVPPEVSMAYCWTCGLWAKAPPTGHSGVPGILREVLLFERARCYRALGMRREALEECRRLLRHYPTGITLPQALQSILELLFEQRNYRAVASLYNDLDRDQRERLLPESLYLIGQGFYILGKDEAAEDLLKRIPPDAQVYPYGLYTLAQVLYRKGDSDRALLILRVVLEAPPQARVPEMLREMAWLTQSRISYQQGDYEKALEGFRILSQSSYFLPEALMGMGWSYKALGSFPKAVAYFQAVAESYADADTLTEAYLEQADAFTKARMYRDAFQVYRRAQKNLLSRISQYKRYGTDPEWLDWLAQSLLDSPDHLGEAPAELPLMDLEADLPREMESLLRKDKFTSTRLKELFEIREGMEQIGLLFEEIANPANLHPKQTPVLSLAYPPLGVPVPALEPRISDLLDLGFALLDTEYRLIHAGGTLELLSGAERATLMQDCLAFYRKELEALLLPPESVGQAREALKRLQSTVRHLPLSLEQRERVLAKLVYAARNLLETENTLDEWASGMLGTSSSETQPTRYLLLEKWMTLVRVFLYLRSWDDRSPAVFLLDHPSLEEHPSSPILSSQETLERVAQRIGTVWQRLALLVKREAANLHLERLEALEGLLARTQFDYADALVREQERILENLKTLPPEADLEDPWE